jgi:hypothetical protein
MTTVGLETDPEFLRKDRQEEVFAGRAADLMACDCKLERKYDQIHKIKMELAIDFINIIHDTHLTIRLRSSIPAHLQLSLQQSTKYVVERQLAPA